MLNKIIIIFSLFFSQKIYSQDCPPSYEKGSAFNISENSTRSFCFIKNFDDSMPGIYHTQYSIRFGKERESYNIQFHFYKATDSISILYLNANDGFHDTRKVTFDKYSSIRMIKNYQANDTLIYDNEKYIILFTIPNILQPYITLNQFQLPDDKGVYLMLSPISSEKLDKHLNEARNYFHKRDSVANEIKKLEEIITRRKQDIDSIKKEMKAYKEKIIKQIETAENEITKNGPPQEANEIYSEWFTKTLDSAFLNCFKKIYPFENLENEITFSFICDGHGKIDTSTTKIDSVKIKWIEDSFKMIIQPYIRELLFKTKSVARNNPTVLDDFDKMAFNDVDADNAEHKQFIGLKAQIKEELAKYFFREVNSPIRYKYTINYRSTVTLADWIYEVDSKGVEKIGPKKNGEIISEDLKNIFKTKIVNFKPGKYRVKICSVFFNDKRIGQDIRLESK